VRILHITPFYEPAWAYGGMARSSAALCRALARRGHEVRVATALLDPSDPLEEVRDGVTVRRFPGPAELARRLVPWARGLAGALRAWTPSVDAVHLHGFRNGLALTAARVLAETGRGWVLMTHGTFPDHGQYPWLKVLFDGLGGRGVWAKASALVAVSEAEARDLPRPARVIPSGVDPCGQAARTRGDGRPRLLFVGSDRFQKRGALLPALLRALPEVELELVGPFRPAFLHTFAGDAARVSARGVLAGDALAAAYADADVVVHPAVGEAFGLVPFEAALLGTPAVVAGGHGCGEWFGRAGGCVVPPDDARALVDAVRARLSDPAGGAREARAVGAFVRERLTWDEAARQMESLYRDVAA
jgi:glycosyltransferase involved in cell wall biosynthesis